MKSAAFNIAFKVHRNEMPFAEGLLKAVDAEAQEDFIVALNSLAGEAKYNVNQLEKLIQEAKQGAGEETKPQSNVNLEALEEELRKLKKKRHDHRESIRTYESQITSMAPSITPGINSVLLVMVGFVMSILFFLLQFELVAGIILLIAFLIAAFLLFMDLDKLKKQKEDIERRKDRFLSEIEKIKQIVIELNQAIKEKEEEYNKAKAAMAPPEDTPSEEEPQQYPDQAVQSEN